MYTHNVQKGTKCSLNGPRCWLGKGLLSFTSLSLIIREKIKATNEIVFSDQMEKIIMERLHSL